MIIYIDQIKSFGKDTIRLLEVFDISFKFLVRLYPILIIVLSGTVECRL